MKVIFQVSGNCVKSLVKWGEKHFWAELLGILKKNIFFENQSIIQNYSQYCPIIYLWPYQNLISKFDIKISYQNLISKFDIKIWYQNLISKFDIKISYQNLISKSHIKIWYQNLISISHIKISYQNLNIRWYRGFHFFVS